MNLSNIILLLIVLTIVEQNKYDQPKLYHRKSTTRKLNCSYNLKVKLINRMIDFNIINGKIVYENTFKFKEKITDSKFNIISEKKSVKKVVNIELNVFGQKKNINTYYIFFYFLLDGKKSFTSNKNNFNKDAKYFEIEKKNFACDSQLPAINYRSIDVSFIPENNLFNHFNGFQWTTFFSFNISDYPKTHLKYDLNEMIIYIKDKEQKFSKFKSCEENLSKVITE